MKDTPYFDLISDLRAVYFEYLESACVVYVYIYALYTMYLHV